MHFHVLGSLHHVHNKNSGLPLYVLQAPCLIVSVNHMREMRTYVVVFICDNNNKRISYKANSEKDPDSGSNPRWNFDVMFNIDINKTQQHSLGLVLRLMSHYSLRPDTIIGEVNLPITVLLEWFGDAAEDVHKVASRYVVTKNGAEQGTLAFSYNFGRTLQHPPPDSTPVNGPSQVWKILGSVSGNLINAVMLLS